MTCTIGSSEKLAIQELQFCVAVASVAYSNDGRWLALGGENGHIVIVDPADEAVRLRSLREKLHSGLREHLDGVTLNGQVTSN